MIVGHGVESLARAGKTGLEPFDRRQHQLRVAATELIHLSSFRETLERELADRLEHCKPMLAVLALEAPDEALVGQALERLDGVDARLVLAQELLGGRDREASDEGAESTKASLVGGGEELVAPVDGLA